MATQRFSKQREQIYQAVYRTDTHPTAQEVYDFLKPLLPHLSLGTVYRNLHQMALDGRLREIEGPPARFDAKAIPHTHFRCISCGCVSDLWSVSYDTALDNAAQGDGRIITGHELTFTGLCPDCAKK